MKMIRDLVLFFCFFNLLGLAAAYQAVSVPGDTDGDKVISAEELKVAEKDFKGGRISSDELETIKLIHESYPRNINDSAGNKITIYSVFVYPEA